MKLDKLIRYWPVAVAVLALGSLTAAVAGNTTTNNKQDSAIQRIIESQKEQAETNGQLKADSKNTKEDINRILRILLDGKARGEPR